ncbi:MAG: GTP-binding protein [Rhodospirillales bacterium]
MEDWFVGAFERRVPVSLLTGFLGSGKTTVLNRLLRHPGLARTAVVINEFGEIGLDHALIEYAEENLVLLQNGCLCCTVRGDLIDTLGALAAKRDDGGRADFDRVIVETTGLADPAPILHTLMTDPQIARHFRLDGVIATVDAANAAASLDRQPEAVKQVAVADRLLLTKADLVDAGAACAVENRLRALNPGAPVIAVRDGAVDPAAILDVGLYDPATKSLAAQRWLNAEAYGGPGHHHHHHHHHDRNRHDDRIRAVCLTWDEPIAGAALELWLQGLLALRGEDMLRLKAIVNVVGFDGPLVLHGVQHILHPPVTLDRWPDSDRRTRIVCIARDMDEAMLRDTLTMFAEDVRPAPKRGRRTRRRSVV